MKKILNWTFGSVFRTFGRIVAYLLVGLLLFLIIDKSGLKINIRKISLTDLLGIGRVYASTYSWTTKQSRLFIDQQGTETQTSWQTIPYTQSVSYPVTQMQYRLSYSGGLTAGNSYTFKISYKPDPDALNTSGIWFSDGTNTLTEVNCSGWMRESNGYYANLCKVTLTSDIPSSGHLYVRIVFNEGYVNSVRSYVGDFEETKGTGAIIQDSSIDIMNNQNENTQAIIDKLGEVDKIPCKNKLNTNATTISSSGITITRNEDYTYTINGTSTANHTFELYTGENITLQPGTYTGSIGDRRNIVDGYIRLNNGDYKTIFSGNNDTNTFTITSPFTYNRFYIYILTGKTFNNQIIKPQLESGSSATTYCKYGTYINASQATQDTINDDNVSGATKDASDFFSSFTTNTHGLTGIITAPLNAIQSLTSSVCEVLVLPLPFVNENLTLPCMRAIYIDNFGAFMTLYDTITLGIISYWIMVRIFALVKDFKNPDHDEIEVMDL